MKKIKVFDGAAIMVDDSLEDSGITFSTNTKHIKDVEATEKNKEKYLKESVIIDNKEEITSR